MNHQSATSERVIEIVTKLLGIEERAHTLDADTALFGALPELDSMAVVELLSEIEVQFGITIDDAEVTGEIFESIGSLADFIDAKRQ